MNLLRYTLVAEGPSDEVLKYPLHWLLAQGGVMRAIEATFPDLRQWPQPLRGLPDRIRAALVLSDPCDLLFVHRDSDGEPRENRCAEIQRAIEEVAADLRQRPYVCVVPVRMTEAWFLFDEALLRKAVDNPHGRVPLDLPSLSRVESLPDPKELLQQLISTATEKPPRRLKGFSSTAAFHRLASLITDFSPLRRLQAFQALEADVRHIIQAAGWNR
ncbi:MAG: DUF4276 family protein [Verrucomicrobia bacterium]|nr:DUF4276 family protein [Verrucomicrobiota bacterium]